MNGRGRRRRAQRTYRILVRLYPAAHRRAFGEQMVQTFGDHYVDTIEDRRLRFWIAVLADTGTSLLIEHAAEVRTRRRPAPKAKRQRDIRGPRRRKARVRRRLRYHQPARVLIRTHHHRLVYRGRIAALIVFAVVTGLAFGTIAATGHLVLGALLAGLVVAAWLARSLRLTRPISAGPHGDGPRPPGGASVREPRRPLPFSPGGSTARPTPDQDEPGQAIAVI